MVRLHFWTMVLSTHVCYSQHGKEGPFERVHGSCTFTCGETATQHTSPAFPPSLQHIGDPQQAKEKRTDGMRVASELV